MDLTKRIDEHNRGKTRFSASGMPWILVFSKGMKNKDQRLSPSAKAFHVLMAEGKGKTSVEIMRSSRRE